MNEPTTIPPRRPLLRLRGLDKQFFGVPVLRQVTFEVNRGEILGLVGENGAGKSTLMNLLGGILSPDAGTLEWEGQDYRPRHPTDATRRGIAFIHQELNLFPNLTIAENLFLTAFPRVSWLPWINRRQMLRRARRLLGRVGLDVPPQLPVESLSAGERQLVEIAKALNQRAQLLILDEPTTSLSAREAARLFERLHELRGQRIAMIYISHALDDVLRLADQLVVLRDGCVVGAGCAAEFDQARLITLMVGRRIQQLYPERTHPRSTEPLLEVLGLSQPGISRGIQFTLHRGEVLGLAGLMGSGRSELARILFGLDTYAAGTLRVRGRPLPRPTPRRCIRHGLAFVTEDRHADGLCLEASIADNITRVALPDFARGPVTWLNRADLSEAVRRMRRAVRLTPTARDGQPVKTLSGGNQQKVVLAGWLLRRPEVFLLDEPTRGIDVGAKQELYVLIRELATQGAGVLLISSELEELTGMCDRILVMRRGELVDELTYPDFDRERLLRSAMDAGGSPLAVRRKGAVGARPGGSA